MSAVTPAWTPATKQPTTPPHASGVVPGTIGPQRAGHDAVEPAGAEEPFAARVRHRPSSRSSVPGHGAVPPFQGDVKVPGVAGQRGVAGGAVRCVGDFLRVFRRQHVLRGDDGWGRSGAGPMRAACHAHAAGAPPERLRIQRRLTPRHHGPRVGPAGRREKSGGELGVPPTPQGNSPSTAGPPRPPAGGHSP